MSLDSAYCRYSIVKINMNKTTNESEVRTSNERLHLSEIEYTTIIDVLKRIDGDHIADHEGDSIFSFANYCFRGFLKELPIVVDILSRHKNESNFEYDDFVGSLKFVAEVITDIDDWRFCLDPLAELCNAMYEVRERQEKERLEAEFGKGA